MRRNGDETKRIVIARSPRADSKRQTSEKYLSGDELIDRNQSKINDVCLTSRANEEEWTAVKKKFSIIDLVCLVVGFVLALASLAVSTWLVFFDKRFQLIKLVVKSFTAISSESVIFLPIVYFSVEATWTFLEIIQIFFSFQVNRILNYTGKETKKRARAPKKGDGEPQGSVKIYDDYLTVSSQSTRTLETIHRLQLRINLRNKFRSLHKWFIIYSVLITLIFVLFIITMKVFIVVFLVSSDVRLDIRTNLDRNMYEFIQKNGEDYFILPELDNTSQNSSLTNTTITSPEKDAGLLKLFSNMNGVFKCCYFASPLGNVSNQTYFIQGPNQCPSQEPPDCFGSIRSTMFFYLVAIFSLLVFTSAVKLVTQFILAFNLHWMLFHKLISKPFEEENRLLKDYNNLTSKIFNTNALKKIEQADETMANQFDALMSTSKGKDQAKYMNDQDEEEDNYDEIPQDVRNTLEEFDKSFEDSEIVPLNQRQSTRSQRYQNINQDDDD